MKFIVQRNKEAGLYCLVTDEGLESEVVPFEEEIELEINGHVYVCPEPDSDEPQVYELVPVDTTVEEDVELEEEEEDGPVEVTATDEPEGSEAD
jgi:hypothetical protein